MISEEDHRVLSFPEGAPGWNVGWWFSGRGSLAVRAVERDAHPIRCWK
jgi:hypothetical protein